MKVILQRSRQACVTVDGRVTGQIDYGLVALVGIAEGDSEPVVRTLADKTAMLRIFADDNGKMNRSVIDVGGGVLAISQFTLLADCRKGRRPAFTGAAKPEIARAFYELYMDCLRGHGLTVQPGVFAADMQVSLTNDGPVTIILDSSEWS
ncbi:D-aminoacyl-tRNA deacylase [Neorhodopirellula pilleata]|uniref:D-aminoacyl-tRNA deacylase n=1 Tax=Neorhodopirellula pilleata TaxID=2714738 RepID=A0A5C5ZQP5_9BACT|nr:D-aminoacyl-tRNA deacylase [Neorhodopirellula pilleata]TWT89536.1 D-tyrosyl-tRNA(Tyr) deacylase [Neorhodopirellula pilleata]